MCIAQGTNDGAAAAQNRPGKCTERSLVPPQVCQMPRALAKGTGRRSTTNGEVAGPFGPLLTLYVHHPRHNTTGRLLLRTDPVHAQGGPQGPDSFFLRRRCAGSLMRPRCPRSPIRPRCPGNSMRRKSAGRTRRPRSREDTDVDSLGESDIAFWGF